MIGDQGALCLLDAEGGRLPLRACVSSLKPPAAPDRKLLLLLA